MFTSKIMDRWRSEPRAVTRDLDWGIDVPVAGAEGKKLYVWFDALSDIFPLPKNGPREKVKNKPGSRHEAGSLYWERQYRFFIV
jgi:methionyl-tRNA synthetase